MFLYAGCVSAEHDAFDQTQGCEMTDKPKLSILLRESNIPVVNYAEMTSDFLETFTQKSSDSINLSCHNANLSPTRLGKAIYRELANSNNRSIHDFSAQYNCIWTRSWLETKSHPPYPPNPERDNGTDLLPWSCFLSSNLFPLLLRQNLDSLSLRVLCVFLFIPLIVIRFY